MSAGRYAGGYALTADGTIRVLVADDHAVVRDGLAAIISLERDMRVVAQACDGHEAIELYRQHRPDVALFDIRMPEMDGIEALTTVREQHPHARIVLLTTFGGDEDIYRGLKAGAKAYLLKAGPREQVTETIRSVHAGLTHIPPEVAARLASRIGRAELTPREVEVLRLVADGRSNQEIASRLYISESTAKAHLNSILNKLHVTDRTQAAIEALKQGIIHLD